MTTYMFPGQGSQAKGMGNTLFDEFPELVEIADSVLGYSVKSLCLQDEDDRLNRTEFTQPALYVVNALSYRKKINETGVIPDFLLGHSLGEYNALQAAGVINFDSGLKLVAKRGALMSDAPEGAMAAIIGISSAMVSDILKRRGMTSIDVANYNSGSQTIISGPVEDITKAKDVFEAENAHYIRLNTGGAFHSRYMEHPKTAFGQYLTQFKFSPPELPVISNVDARPYRVDNIVANLAEQITGPVQWVKSISYLMDQGEEEFEELGPGKVLTKLMGQIRADRPPITPNSEQVQSRADASARSGISQQDSPVNLAKKITEWNKKYPIGIKVTVKTHNEQLKTRTEACLLFGHRAAIYIQGYNGYFDLNDVTPVS